MTDYDSLFAFVDMLSPERAQAYAIECARHVADLIPEGVSEADAIVRARSSADQRPWQSVVDAHEAMRLAQAGRVKVALRSAYSAAIEAGGGDGSPLGKAAGDTEHEWQMNLVRAYLGYMSE